MAPTEHSASFFFAILCAKVRGIVWVNPRGIIWGSLHSMNVGVCQLSAGKHSSCVSMCLCLAHYPEAPQPEIPKCICWGFFRCTTLQKSDSCNISDVVPSWLGLPKGIKDHRTRAISHVSGGSHFNSSMNSHCPFRR